MFSPVSSSHEVRPQPIRRGSSADLGHAEMRRVGGDAQVAGGRHFEAGAQRVAFEAADHRHGTVADRLAELVDHGDEGAAVLGRAHPRHVVDVGAADEGAATRAREDDDTKVLLGRQSMERRGEIVQGRRVEDVEPPRIVEHEMGDHAGVALVATNLDLVGGFGHDVSLRGSL